MENSTVIATIIFKYIRKDLTPAENGLLQDWIHASEDNLIFFEECVQTGRLFTEAQEREKYDQEINMAELWPKMVSRGLPTPAFELKPSNKRTWMSVAAVLLVIAILGGTYWWLQPGSTATQTISTTTDNRNPNDLSPATRHATLTLADGSKILLDSAHRGELAKEGKTTVTREADGGVVYKTTAADEPVLYNTLTVPRGSDVVHITLADGTKVWLNAASSLRYPVVFDARERKVEITGEGYFEVAHNAAAPFTVTKDEVAVAVLGTHFNVNAYEANGQVKVTLLQGAVKVSVHNPQGATDKILAPGQQAVVNKGAAITVDKTADESLVMAWKNGMFSFKKTNIDEIVRQLERWYDVSIEYDPALKDLDFNGQISRYNHAAKVLEKLAATQSIHYRIDNRKIYVTP
jgi:ferric-dicitrate binding protein FerR (iron transport regulator)